MIYKKMKDSSVKSLEEILSSCTFGRGWGTQEEIDTAIQVQILDDLVCISHRVNTLGKGVNPTILPLDMDK